MTRRLPLLGMAAIGVIAVGAAGASPASAQGLKSVTFTATGTMQTWAVPAGVQSVGVALTGGAGGLGANNAFTSAYTTTATLTMALRLRASAQADFCASVNTDCFASNDIPGIGTIAAPLRSRTFSPRGGL